MEKMFPFTDICLLLLLPSDSGWCLWYQSYCISHPCQLAVKDGVRVKVVFCCNRVSVCGRKGEEIQKVTVWTSLVSKWDCSGKEKADVHKKDPLLIFLNKQTFYQWKQTVPWFKRLDYVFRYIQTVVSWVLKKYFNPQPWPLVLVLLLQFYLSM